MSRLARRTVVMPGDDPWTLPTPFLEWEDFQNRVKWEQGEHVTMIGHTGGGKTTLLQRWVRRRGFVVFFAVKSEDSSMTKLVKAGYKKQTVFNGKAQTHIVLWPNVKTDADMEHQYYVFRDAINETIGEGGWTLVFDEVSYMSDMLGMTRQLKWALQQGRSSHNSVVAATQRPAFIPLAFYDQATHLFFWAENDEANLKRIRGIAGRAGRIVAEEVSLLRSREVLYLNTRTRERYRTIVKLGKG